MAPQRRPETGEAECSRCGETKDVSDFKQRTRSDGSRTWMQPCRLCAGVASRRWQKDNAERNREHNRRANAKRMGPLKQIIRQVKSKPCVDCGVRLPWQCMDLDHVRGRKVRTIGNGTGFGVETLQAEIAKCDVRCPNCHRLRHFYARDDDTQTAFDLDEEAA